MIRLIKYDKKGAITDSVSVIPELRDKYPDYIEVSESVGVLTHYISNDRCMPIGTAPSDAHVFSYENKQWELSDEKAKDGVRAQRETLLKQSDWTQLPDVPLSTKEAWSAYRQALRDITDQPGFPLHVVWPVQPS